MRAHVRHQRRNWAASSMVCLAADDFAHAAKALADVEQKAAGDELEENVDEAIDLAAGWLLDVSI